MSSLASCPAPEKPSAARRLLFQPPTTTPRAPMCCSPSLPAASKTPTPLSIAFCSIGAKPVCALPRQCALIFSPLNKAKSRNSVIYPTPIGKKFRRAWTWRWPQINHETKMGLSRVAALACGANARREVARGSSDADERRFGSSEGHIEVIVDGGHPYSWKRRSQCVATEFTEGRNQCVR